MLKYERVSFSLNLYIVPPYFYLLAKPTLLPHLLAPKLTAPNSKDFIKCDSKCCTNVFFRGKYTKELDINRCIKSYWRSSEVLHSRKAWRLTSNLSWSVKGCRNNKICMKNIEIMRTSNLNEKLMCLMI